MLKVNEIFYSIQGEGRNAGLPAVFIRLSGCDRACAFCDTKDHVYGVDLEEEEIVRSALEYPTRCAILTGGEPTVQYLGLLFSMLKEAGFWVAIETNGDNLVTLPFDWITVSPKAPHFTQRTGDEMKVIYLGENVERLIDENPAFTHYYLQPCSGRNILETIEYVKRHPRWKVSLQWHKMIFIK